MHPDLKQMLNEANDKLSPRQFEVLDRAIRVDQAGEIAANWIYRGQLAVFKGEYSAKAEIQVTIHGLFVT